MKARRRCFCEVGPAAGRRNKSLSFVTFDDWQITSVLVGTGFRGIDMAFHVFRTMEMY